MSTKGNEKEQKSIEMRLTNIESKLDALTRSRSEIKASKEDIETYLKVLRAAEDDDWGGGLNECMKCIPSWFKIDRVVDVSIQRILEKIRYWPGPVNECMPGWLGGPLSQRGRFSEFGR